MNHPLVSVGMPVFNGEKWIRRALDSLLNQDYPNIELIISDNASTDSTSAICSEYVASEKNVRVVSQEHALGIVGNFKAVLHEAKGKYFMWAAVDDSWDCAFISRLVEKMESNERFAVAQSGALNLAESDLNIKINYVRFQGRNNPEKCSKLRLTNKIVSPMKYNLFMYGLFRKELLIEAFAFFPGVSSSDRWFLLQFPLAGYKFGYVDAPLYIRTIRDTPVYLRYQNDAYSEQVRYVEKKWFDFGALPAVKKMLNESTLTAECGNRIKNLVLFQVALGRIKLGLRLMIKYLILKSLSEKTSLRIIRKVRNISFD
ncbi:MAG: glycosyltransferase [Betaproteobacteria bacterium]|nr:glycosyltransferase [Betaproteobacteria bacterium]